MNQITESVFNGETTIIPMADVQHIERHWHFMTKRNKNNYRGISIITKHTKWDKETGAWANNIFLDKQEADRFLKVWCNYRHEIDVPFIGVDLGA